jgi:hypothetical protein
MRLTSILFVSLVLTGMQPAYSQVNMPVNNSLSLPTGFSYEQWESMTKRWQPYSSWIKAYLKDGRIVEGQVTWLSDSVILIQKNRLLPTGAFNPGDYEQVPVVDIEKVSLRESGHPYQGLIIGALLGAVPGAVTGLILAQGWTVIPAIVFGAVTSAAGGLVGSKIQKGARQEEIHPMEGTLSASSLKTLKRSSLFRDSVPAPFLTTEDRTREGFEIMIPYSAPLNKAFPDNKWSLSVNTSLITNDVRKKIQVWHMAPIWGPAEGYYETRIGLEASLSRKIGRQLEAGVLLNTVPGDVSYTYFNKYLEELGVDYQYNRSFHQNTIGVFTGWRLGPSGRFYAQRLSGSIQAGALLSDVYEHFYYQWRKLSDYNIGGEKLTQTHHWLPGGLVKVKADYHLIPGFSLNIAAEAFWIKPLWFSERTVLPETEYGPLSMPAHKLNFSNFQLCGGFSVHF